MLIESGSVRIFLCKQNTMDKLQDLNLARRHYGTLYDKTQLDYSYLEYVLDHIDDVSPYRDEIVDLYKACQGYVLIYEEAIYGQFLRLLEQLLRKMDYPESVDCVSSSLLSSSRLS